MTAIAGLARRSLNKAIMARDNGVYRPRIDFTVSRKTTRVHRKNMACMSQTDILRIPALVELDVEFKAGRQANIHTDRHTGR